MNNSKKLRRARIRMRRRSAPGTKPGTMVIPQGAYPTRIRIMAYDHEQVVEKKIESPSELTEFIGKWPVVWVDVVGLGSEDTLRSIGDVFRIHPLALEDVVHVHQRAKVDTYQENLYVVMRMPDASHEQICEQFSLFLGKDYVVTFQERPGDSFDLVRAGIRLRDSAARQGVKADYLAYRLIDAAIDAYFPVLEKMGDHLDTLDDPSAIEHTRSAFSELHVARRELLILRRAVWPLRDALSELRSDVTPFISEGTRVYLRDCYDHAVQLIDLLESYRDIAGDVRDYYLSTISNRMNEIMKTLTIIATIFLPITFIAGVYGMNFNPQASPWNMPELNWPLGYFFSLGLMVAVTAAMLWYFQWKGWLRGTFTEEMPDEEPES
ncbi:MAG: magnesium/cobalt transporter CorA [Pirellulales bacterium]